MSRDLLYVLDWFILFEEGQFDVLGCLVQHAHDRKGKNNKLGEKNISFFIFLLFRVFESAWKDVRSFPDCIYSQETVLTNGWLRRLSNSVRNGEQYFSNWPFWDDVGKIIFFGTWYKGGTLWSTLPKYCRKKVG